MRLIDADALLYSLGASDRDMYVAECINEAPTIEAAPVVHGRWEDKPTGRYGQQQSWCSACRKPSGIGGIDKNRHRAYCPNCGARMDGDSKAPTTHTTGSNYQSCKHCNSTFIGLEEYAECPVCGQPFEEDANG